MQDTVIGIIEDDAVHAALLEAILSRAGFSSLSYESTRDFRRRNGIHSVDLILLDWNMPGESGLSYLKSIRAEADPDIPVIFTTSNDLESQIVEALNAGADDYLIKPVRANELVARIECTLRRTRITPEEREQYGRFEFHPEKHALDLNGHSVKTTPKEFELLLFMFRRAGRIVGRDAILTHVWRTGSDISTRSIDTYISRLRKNFGLDGTSGWIIEGIYQQGYRLRPVDEDMQ